MKKPLVFLLAPVLLWACAGLSKSQSGQDSYYVASSGSDRGDGLSEQTPFRSLFKAMSMAAGTPVKTITVIGALDAQSEQSTNRERVFLVQAMGTEPILIRGKASGEEQPALSAAGSGRRTVLVRGSAPIRFEHIEISGGVSTGEGGGLGIGPGSQVILGEGAVVRDNRSENIGGGVFVAPGASLLVEGGRIVDNRSAAMGGGVAVVGGGGAFLLRRGEISGNQAQGGGGVAVYQGGTFTLAGGSVQGNRADLAGGGVVVNQDGIFSMEGGYLRGNRSSLSGGGAALLGGGRLVLKNGEIRENEAAEHGGGVASDDTGAIGIEGGFIAANRAAVRGGGIFTAGTFVKSGGKIYGSDVPAAEANAAPGGGAAVFVFRGEGMNKTREASAGEDLALDAAAGEGWQIHSGETE